MSGYAFLSKLSSRCIHFVHQDEPDEWESDQAQNFICSGGTLVEAIYNYDNNFNIFDEVLSKLDIDLITCEGNDFTTFADQMITASCRESAVAIVIKNTRLAFVEIDENLLQFIEAFLLQKGHWDKYGKPCNLIIHF